MTRMSPPSPSDRSASPSQVSAANAPVISLPAQATRKPESTERDTFERHSKTAAFDEDCQIFFKGVGFAALGMSAMTFGAAVVLAEPLLIAGGLLGGAIGGLCTWGLPGPRDE